jgi:chromosome segregation ATPase
VRPTEVEIATEKESFYEEKRGIESEVEQVRQKIGSETRELENLSRSFGEFYTKVYGRMEALEKMVAPLPAAKTVSDEVLGKYQSELATMESGLDEMRGALDGMRDEMAGLEIGRGPGRSEQVLERVERMNGELIALQQEMGQLRKKAATQEQEAAEVSMPTVKDIKKKFESMQKDLAALRSRNAQMRQDMLSLHESSEILKSVAESIMGQEDKIVSLRGEVASLSQEAGQLAERTNSVVAKVKQNVELIERLGDSVDVAKAVLKKFPSQDKVMEGLDKLKAEEDAMAGKTDDLAKLLDAVGGRQVTAKQFAEITKRIEERSVQIRKDMDALETALQDEKGTYLTFQKIKERVVPSIEGYQQQLDAMGQRLAKMREEASAQMQGMRQEAQKLQESLKGGQAQDIVKVAEEIRDKKRALDEIRTALDDMVTMSENLNKRVTLLSREAKLLDIRTGGEGGAGGAAGPAPSAPGGEGGAGGGGIAAEEKGIRQKLELTQQEELEFRRKREELKKLIQRLWE